MNFSDPDSPVSVGKRSKCEVNKSMSLFYRNLNPAINNKFNKAANIVVDDHEIEKGEVSVTNTVKSTVSVPLWQFKPNIDSTKNQPSTSIGCNAIKYY